MGVYLRGRSWVSDFFHDGERYTKSWGEISKSVAKEKDAKFKTEVKEGKHTLKAKKILFEKFAEKYLEYARLNKKPKSAKRNEVSINMLKLHFKGKLLGSIHPFMLEQYKKTRKEEGRAVATINRDLVTMKNMFRKAVEWGEHLHQSSFWSEAIPGEQRKDVGSNTGGGGETIGGLSEESSEKRGKVFERPCFVRS